MKKARQLRCLPKTKTLLVCVLLLSGQALASAPEIAHSASHKFVITANGGAAWCGAKLHLRMVIQPDSPDIGHEDALIAIMHRMKAVVAANCPRATSAEITVVSAGKALGKYTGDALGDWSFSNIVSKTLAAPTQTASPAAPPPAPMPELPPPPPKPTTIDTLALSTYLSGLRNLEAVTLINDKEGSNSMRRARATRGCTSSPGPAIPARKQMGQLMGPAAGCRPWRWTMMVPSLSRAAYSPRKPFRPSLPFGRRRRAMLVLRHLPRA